MIRLLLITIGLLQWVSNDTFAQFNTVTQGWVHPKVVSTRLKRQAKQSRCHASHRRDSMLVTPQQDKAEQTDRLPALVSPLRNISVTSPFGWRTDPFTKRKTQHNGLNLKAYYEPAYAMMYGEVINVGKDKCSGLYVTLRHGNFTVSYCHLSQVIVTKGTHVRLGTIIAITGNSGRSTGPHLHLTLKKDGKNINPAILLHLIKRTSMGNMSAESIANPEN